MRPNLSLENFAAVLAVLGAGALTACGGSEPKPVQANDVAPATSAGPTGNASCSSSGCGAKAGGGAAATAASAAPAATTPDTSAASGAGASATPTATTAAPGTPAPATTTAAPATTTAKATPKPGGGKRTGSPPKKPAAGESSCGAGTCSTDTKKIF
jgi:hypothetical protein